MLSLQDIQERIFERQGTTLGLSSAKWSGAQIVASINDEFRTLRRAVRDDNPDLVTEAAEAELVKDEAYSLPSALLRIIDVRESSGDRDVPLERFSYGGDSDFPQHSKHYEVRGNTIILRNTSGMTATIRYLRDWGDLHYGTAPGQATTDTTFRLAEAAANATGRIVNTADYYNGLILMIHAGTGIGQFKTVTDHTVSSGNSIVTVDSAWETEPDGTSEYGFLPPWGEEFNELLVVGALARSPLTSWRAEALNDPIYPQLREGLARWARSQSAGGQQAVRSLNRNFGNGEL